MVIPAEDFTPDEQRLLRTEGVTITEAKRIGNEQTGYRIFTPIPGKEGFVKIVGANHFSIRNVNIETAQKIVIQAGDVETSVIFGDVDLSGLDKYIKITGDANTKNIDVSGNKFQVKYDKDNPPKFVLNDEGELDAGTKFETKAGTYTLRGYKVDLPEGSIVEYLEDRVVVSVPSDSEVIPTVDENIQGLLEIKTNQAGYLKTQGGKLQGLQKTNGDFNKKETRLFYSFEDGKIRAYVKNQYYYFLNEEGGVDFSFVNTRFGENNPELDLVFDENQLSNRPSVLVTDNKIGSVFPKGKGAIVVIGSGNRLGIDNIEPSKKTLSFQSYDGHAIITRGEAGKISVLELKGKSLYGPDRESFFREDNNKLYWKDSHSIEEVNHGDGAVALRVELIDNKGEKVNFQVFTTNENYHVSVPEGEIEGPSELGYFIGKAGTIVSPSVAFNQLTPESRKIFTELTEKKQKKLVEDILKKGDFSTLETLLKKTPRRANNPITGSVKIEGFGEGSNVGKTCSGTIVGFGNKVYVLTAAHCVDLPGYKGEVEGMSAEIVAFSHPDEGSDLALLELTGTPQQINDMKKRRIKIAKTEDYVKVGDRVAQMGCGGGLHEPRICTVTGIDNSIGIGGLTTSQRRGIIGESGGGLFFKGRQIGVFRGGDAYANLKSIHKLLDDASLSQLYKFILIFFK